MAPSCYCLPLLNNALCACLEPLHHSSCRLPDVALPKGSPRVPFEYRSVDCSQSGQSWNSFNGLSARNPTPCTPGACGVTGHIVSALHAMWPTTPNNEIMITCARQLGQAGLTAPHSAWPAPYACLTTAMNEMRV
jgi:hypothetical protein